MVKHNRMTEWQLDGAYPASGGRAAAAGSGVVLGIGDDCAIYAPRAAAKICCFTTDLLIEDVHFLRAHAHRAEDVGWKALARGLSDIAAMGGEPRFCLVSLALRRLGRRALGGRLLSRPAAAGPAGRRAAGRRRSGARRAGWPAISWCAARFRAARALRRDGARAGRRHLRFGRAGRVGAGAGAGRGRALAAAPAPRTAPGAGPISARAAARHRRHGSERRPLARSAPPVPGLRAAAPKSKRRRVFPGAPWRRRSTAAKITSCCSRRRRARAFRAEFEGVPLTRIGTMRKGRPGAVTAGWRAASAARLRPFPQMMNSSRSRTGTRSDRSLPPFQDHVHRRRWASSSACTSAPRRPGAGRWSWAPAGCHRATARWLRRARPAAKREGVYTNQPVAEAYCLRQPAYAARLRALFR